MHLYINFPHSEPPLSSDPAPKTKVFKKLLKLKQIFFSLVNLFNFFNYHATDDLPPSTPNICPVTQELSLLNKKLASEEKSSPFPILLMRAF